MIVDVTRVTYDFEYIFVGFSLLEPTLPTWHTNPSRGGVPTPCTPSLGKVHNDGTSVAKKASFGVH